MPIVVIGETIVDELVRVLPSKNPVGRRTPHFDVMSKQHYLGGAAAVHRALVSAVPELEFISNATLRTSPGACTTDQLVRKVRFQSYGDHSELFKLNITKNSCQPLRLPEKRSDGGAAIVYDYGHGWIDKEAWQQVRSSFRILFGNFQVNSSTDHETFDPSFSLLDYAFLNREEATVSAPGARSLPQAATHLARLHPNTVFIVTDAHRGVSICSERSGSCEYFFKDSTGSEPTGAGDIFQAVFALRVLSGSTLEAAVTSAHKIATRKANTWFHEEFCVEDLLD